MILLLSQKLRRKILLAHKSVRAVIVLSALLILVWCGSCLSYYYLEKADWGEANWQTWQSFTTIGYGNAPAASGWGRIGMMIFATVGIFTMANLVGAYVDNRGFRKEKRRLGMTDNPDKNGYVIFNFPGEKQFMMLLRELRVVEPRIPICIVDDRLEALPAIVAVLPGIHFVRGSILDRGTYQRAGVKDAKIVVVMPVDRHDSKSDAITQTVVSALTQFISNGTRIIHMIVDRDNNWMFDKLPSTPLTIHGEFLTLVQELTDPGTAQVVDTLLHNSSAASPTTVIPNLIVGITWKNFVVGLMNASEITGDKLNPLALLRGGQSISCPPNNERLLVSDRISIAADLGFKWKNFEPVLLAEAKRLS